MKFQHTLLVTFFISTITLFGFSFKAKTSNPIPQQLLQEITQSNESYKNLAELTQIGPRLSGSANAAKAVEWAKKKMESYGFDKVTLHPCTVPSWSRGSVEKATLLTASGAKDLKITALGTSVGTPKQGIEAEVMEVKSFDELNQLGNSLQGKIVFYNVPMSNQNTYGKLYKFRSQGAVEAAKHGAVATLLRSLSTLPDDDSPHTGIMSYKSGINKIPAGAISTHAANILSSELKLNPKARVKLILSGGEVTQVPSYNVAGEITGTELPNEVFIVGGHLDSWDLGSGAHDDGAGVVHSLEALRAMKALKIRPKRTLRAVLFMSEEFGAIGAEQYAEAELKTNQKFIGVLESDHGGFAPVGFTVHAKAHALEKVKSWSPYLALAKASQIIETNGGGADTEVFGEAGVPEFEFVPEPTHYFDLHHSDLDQLKAVNPNELKLGASAIAIFSYLATQEGVDLN